VNVLVTGAAGTLGREAVAHLRSIGWRVRAHDLVPLDPAQADEVVTGDLRDAEHVRSLVDGMSGVVHAAAIPSPRPDEQAVFTNNVMSAYQVLDASGRGGVPRIVYVSSLSALGFAYSEHGASPESVPVTETHPSVAEDVYGLSKYLGEQIAHTTALRWGGTVVNLRSRFSAAANGCADTSRACTSDRATTGASCGRGWTPVTRHARSRPRSPGRRPDITSSTWWRRTRPRSNRPPSCCGATTRQAR
jgi:UDP-glucose 4-epimerase